MWPANFFTSPSLERLMASFAASISVELDIDAAWTNF
jgi:hypothetical protein